MFFYIYSYVRLCTNLNGFIICDFLNGLCHGLNSEGWNCVWRQILWNLIKCSDGNLVQRGEGEAGGGGNACSHCDKMQPQGEGDFPEPAPCGLTILPSKP